MNTQDIALFLEVARSGSFAEAARRRGLDPSAVSRAVAGLETRLGLRLFERTTRRLSLTEAGETCLARMAPLVEELEAVAAAARDSTTRPSGHLRLSASVSFGQRVIVPRLAAFRAAFPSVTVEGLFSDANVDLVAERIDLAIRLAPAVSGDLIVSRLMTTRYRVVASPAYLAGAPRLAAPADLAGHRVLRFPFADYRDRWLFRDRAGALIEQPIDGDLVLAPALALLEAARGGLGPALLPDWLVDDDLAGGRLVHCLTEWQATATDFDTAAWLVYPSRAYLPAKTRAMIDFLRAELQG